MTSRDRFLRPAVLLAAAALLSGCGVLRLPGSGDANAPVAPGVVAPPAPPPVAIKPPPPKPVPDAVPRVEPIPQGHPNVPYVDRGETYEPERADVPVYFTEVGQPVDARNDETAQASQLIKIYTMGLAQGAARIHWFEPLDGDSGPFGLIGPEGRQRPAHTALRTLSTHLGPQPRPLGWLLLAGQHHGFLFDGPQGLVLVAWSRPDSTATVALPAGSRVVDPLSGAARAATSLPLNTLPTLALLPREASDWVQQASANQTRPFPWHGDHSGARRIEFTAPGGEAGARGLHLVQEPTWRTLGTEPVLDAAPRATTSFTVDPNFLSYSPQPLRITAVVRRNSATAAGFNLKYESRSGTSSLGWNTVPAQGEWTTLSWSIADAQFVGKFGYHFSFDSDSTRHSGYSIRSVSVSKE